MSSMLPNSRSSAVVVGTLVAVGGLGWGLLQIDRRPKASPAESVEATAAEQLTADHAGIVTSASQSRGNLHQEFVIAGQIPSPLQSYHFASADVEPADGPARVHFHIDWLNGAMAPLVEVIPDECDGRLTSVSAQDAEGVTVVTAVFDLPPTGMCSFQVQVSPAPEVPATDAHWAYVERTPDGNRLLTALEYTAHRKSEQMEYGITAEGKLRLQLVYGDGRACTEGECSNSASVEWAVPVETAPGEHSQP